MNSSSRNLRPGRRSALIVTALCALPLAFALERARAANAQVGTTLVTNTNNSGPGSMQQAILDINASVGPNIMGFDIPTFDPNCHDVTVGSAIFHVCVINPLTELPPITAAGVTIDGTTQPGFDVINRIPLIVLDGTNTVGATNPSFANGLTVTGGNTTIRSLTIKNFTSSGIDLTVNGGNAVQNCNIGTDGQVPAPNLIGLSIESSNNTISNSVISGNTQDGIRIESISGSLSGNLILSNLIGMNAAGTAAVPNGMNGILLGPTATATAVGGTTPGAGNTISGNAHSGIEITSILGNNSIGGNVIGLDLALNPLPNATAVRGLGTLLITDSPNNTVSGNIIAGNSNGPGVKISNIVTSNGATGNFLLGNKIGLPPNPADRGNNTGIVISATFGNTVGGTSGTTPGKGCAGDCNLVVANAADGLVLDAASSNVVQGNFFESNGGSGVLLLKGASNNTIGGTTSAGRNVISNNTLDGITLEDPFTNDNVIQGNFIGLGGDGSPFGNGRSGIGFGSLGGAPSNNTIGGTVAGAGNFIANQTFGVNIVNGTGDAILGNSLFHNSIGIAFNGSVPANDHCDPDTGPNNQQNAPVISLVSSSGGASIVEGALDSAANTPYLIQIYTNGYSGGCEGRALIATRTVTTNSGCSALIVLTTTKNFGGESISATATDPNGNTSPFSPCVQATGDSSCLLDVAGIGTSPAAVATNLTYIFRYNFGQPPVPNSFRLLDPSIPPDATIAANIMKIGSGLDVDGDGDIDASDYDLFTRVALGMSEAAPPGSRNVDSALPSDATIEANVLKLCPSLVPR